MDVSRGAIDSRFGIRLLLVFAACAVLPVLAFSTLAYFSTRTQLESDAASSLSREAKSATMGIVERIEIGAAHLAFASATGDLESLASERIFERIEHDSPSSYEFSSAQVERLEQGGVILLSAGAVGLRKLELLRLERGDLLVGTFSAEFLFVPGRVGEGERYWVSDHSGEILFTDQAMDRNAPIAAEFLSANVRTPFFAEGPGGEEIAVRWPLFLNFAYVYPELVVGISRSVDTVHRPLREFEEGFAVAVLLALLGSVGIAFWQIRVRTGPLNSLIETTRSIEDGDFSVRANVRSGDEFDLLGSSINSMVENLEGHFSTMAKLQEVADQLLEAQDLGAVSRAVIPAGSDLASADGSAFFLYERNVADVLGEFRAMGEGQDLHIESDSARGKLLGQAIERGSAVLAFRGETPNDSVWTALDDGQGMRCEACVVIPFGSGGGDPAAVLELVFASVPDPEELAEQIATSLALLTTQTEAALGTVGLIDDLRGLFEGVVELTVDAIDKKSPYTGDHCRRVPILTEMIADAACSDKIGALKEFSLSDTERYELKIAALLHDCGKVATPVHVMDKATKLEKIGDRLELVTLRAEIILRDLERQAIQGLLDQHGLNFSMDQEWRLRQSQVTEDLEFVTQCNIGGEVMEDLDRVRVDEVAERYQWMDRFGQAQPLLNEDERMNLKIGRGTLNDAEREIINQHVTTTIQLLERLPFPSGMKNVPAIAGAHHEHVDGTGYPLGLSEADLSLQGRILGLADVYEALTAIDRPYKKGNTLTETLGILDRLVESGKLDRDLHELFVREKIYLRYAVEHMKPHQIDEPHLPDLENMTAAWADLGTASL
ncbi:MAG: HD domain-containing phosphohydrolase [Myxococcota bacterium]